MIPGVGRSPGGGHGNPLLDSCLENPHGQWSLVGYSPWGHRVGPTERLSTHKLTGHLGSPSDARMRAFKHSTAALAGTVIEYFRRDRNFGNGLVMWPQTTPLIKLSTVAAASTKLLIHKLPVLSSW